MGRQGHKPCLHPSPATHTSRRATWLDDTLERSKHMTANDHSLLHLVILSPRYPEPKNLEFPHSELVGEAARRAAEAFEYSPGTPSFQTANRVTLDRNISLAAAHVHNGDHLELVDVGAGV
jgi:hypothetical protein